jgi:hypothetical protein
MENKKTTLLDFLGACLLGAALAAIIVFGFFGGF